MLYQQLKENESLQRMIRDRRGSAVITIKGGIDALQQKTTLLSSTVTTGGEALSTTGVLPISRSQTIMPGARRRVFMRDLLTVTPLGSAVADYVGVETDVAEASPQADGGDKLENALKLISRSATARTISTYLPVSRQMLSDLSQLQGFIEGSLRYSVLRKEQDQILIGSNTGQQLNGMATQAQAFDTSLLVSADGWEYADCIGRAAQQIDEDEESQANFCVMHPTRYWATRLQKHTASGATTSGLYVHDPFSSGDEFRLFGLRVLSSKAVSLNQFIVGSADPDVVELLDRDELTIEIAYSHSDYFSKNLAAIRAEERVALLVYKPSSFVTGSFTQSPA
jgi:HK97 family phage major capsid protein